MTPTPQHPWWAPPSAAAAPPARATLTTRVRRTARTATLTVVAVAAVSAILASGKTTPATQAIPGGGTAHRQTVQALIAGCGPTYTFTVNPADAPALTPDPDGTLTPQRYRTIVPFFGPYQPQPGPPARRFYTPTDPDIPTVEATVGHAHAGRLIAWYTKDADPKDVASLRTLTADPALDLLVLPWESTDRGLLPANRKIAYATWAASQTCQRLNAAALGEFRTAHPATAAPSGPGRPR